jgi:hypothetical protein
VGPSAVQYRLKAARKMLWAYRRWRKRHFPRPGEKKAPRQAEQGAGGAGRGKFQLRGRDPSGYIYSQNACGKTRAVKSGVFN